VTDTILFSFDGRRQLSDFNEKVDIHANLENTTLYPEDLARFFPAAARLSQPVVINGKLNGRISEFKATDMEVKTGNRLVSGSLGMEGLPLLSEPFTILELKSSTLDFRDLKGLLEENALERVTPLGRVNMEGQFLGYFTDFVANGTFNG